MFATDDTIVAIATPAGRGALGVVRLSGPRARDYAGAILDCGPALQPRHATLTRVTSSDSVAVLDEVVATFFPAPHSYTGEHVIEITGHGSPVLLQAVLQRAITAGARLAEPGEFTFRSFLNGKRDLIQAEAVADLIDAATPLQARVAFDQLEGTLTERIKAIDAQLFDLIARLEGSLDFPDEGFHFMDPAGAATGIDHLITGIDDLLKKAAVGRMVREGATVVIAGRPNVGKSSIFNILAGASRAIVTSIPGTTRDLVTETVNLDGVAVTLVDTGYPGDRAALLASLAEIGSAPEAVRAVLITHAHNDHLGSAEHLRATYGTPVYLHEAEAPHARREFLHQVGVGTVLRNGWRPGVLPWAVHALRSGGT